MHYTIIDLNGGSQNIQQLLAVGEYREYRIVGTLSKPTTLTLSCQLAARAECIIRVRCSVAEHAALSLLFRVEHQGDASKSSVDTRVVVHNGASALYAGRVIIPRFVHGADATQYARILLVGDTAHARAEPIIEVEAQDVACKHGSAVGPIDADQLILLQSRGINYAHAQTLCVRAFLEQ